MNPLVKLAAQIDWDGLDEQFATLYAEAGRYAHARQMKRLGEEVKRLRTYLGRTVRDIERKAEMVPKALRAELELELANRLLVQQRYDQKTLQPE